MAETIHLWHRRFDSVFAFQSKPAPLSVDEFLRRLDERLTLHSQTYRDACAARPNGAIHLLPGPKLEGEERHRLLRDNLLEALRNERLLLVLDNFETQLETVSGSSGYACADPEWDRLLDHLAKGLPGTGSRLVVTSRHRLAALASPERALLVALGPLPMEQAVLFLQGTEALRRLAFGDDAGWVLARRLLSASRGHPLILTRLGTLAGDRAALAAALDELETKGLGRLPDVFTRGLSPEQREEERRLPRGRGAALGGPPARTPDAGGAPAALGGDAGVGAGARAAARGGVVGSQRGAGAVAAASLAAGDGRGAAGRGAAAASRDASPSPRDGCCDRGHPGGGAARAVPRGGSRAPGCSCRRGTRSASTSW